jgi:hypothetical protein
MGRMGSGGTAPHRMHRQHRHGDDADCDSFDNPQRRSFCDPECHGDDTTISP